MHKGFKCLDVSTGRVYISRDVIFDQSVFPFAQLHPNAGARLRSEILLHPTSLNPTNFHPGGECVNGNISDVPNRDVNLPAGDGVVLEQEQEEIGGEMVHEIAQSGEHVNGTEHEEDLVEHSSDGSAATAPGSSPRSVPCASTHDCEAGPSRLARGEPGEQVGCQVGQSGSVNGEHAVQQTGPDETERPAAPSAMASDPAAAIIPSRPTTRL